METTTQPKIGDVWKCIYSRRKDRRIVVLDVGHDDEHGKVVTVAPIRRKRVSREKKTAKYLLKAEDILIYFSRASKNLLTLRQRRNYRMLYAERA